MLFFIFSWADCHLTVIALTYCIKIDHMLKETGKKMISHHIQQSLMLIHHIQRVPKTAFFAPLNNKVFTENENSTEDRGSERENLPFLLC